MEPTQTLTPITPTEIEETPEEKEIITRGDVLLQKFKAAYIQEGNATKAYLSIRPHVTPESAKVLGHRMLARVNLSELMEEMGLSDKALLTQVAIGITKPVRKIQKRITSYEQIPLDGENRYVKDKRGRAVLLGTKTITEFEYEDMPDYEERRKNTEIALKLKKKLDSKADISIGEMTVNVVNYAQEGEANENISGD